MRVTQILYVEPVAKVRMLRSDVWKRRPCVQRWHAYKDALREAGATLEEGDSLTFVFAMPPSWSAKKRSDHNCTLHRNKPDTDNLVGGYMDAVLPDGDERIAILGRTGKLWGLRSCIIVEPAANPTFLYKELVAAAVLASAV